MGLVSSLLSTLSITISVHRIVLHLVSYIYTMRLESDTFKYIIDWVVKTRKGNAMEPTDSCCVGLFTQKPHHTNAKAKAIITRRKLNRIVFDVCVCLVNYD